MITYRYKWYKVVTFLHFLIKQKEMNFSLYFILAFMSWSVAESKSNRLGFFKRHHAKLRMAVRYRQMHLFLCRPTTCLESCRVVYSIGNDGKAETTTVCPTHRRYRMCCQWDWSTWSYHIISYLLYHITVILTLKRETFSLQFTVWISRFSSLPFLMIIKNEKERKQLTLTVLLVVNTVKRMSL